MLDGQQSTGSRDRETGVAGGVYLHVPFCRTICPYCDFAVVRDRDPADHGIYLRALLASIAAEEAELSLRTIYLGGGTPARLDPALLAELIDAVQRRFAGAARELTLEANPEDLSAARLEAWRRAGIDRLSVGVQRLDSAGLRRLGRARSRTAIERLPRLLGRWRDAGGRRSVDLLYGVPAEQVVQFGEQMRTVLDWPIDHLSAYALTVEPGTPYARAVARGRLVPADGDVVADCYDTLLDAIAARGWHAYEVSNFCRPGAGARHNTAYWEGRPYLGFGLAASSMLVADGRRRRFRRPSEWSAYVASPERREEIEVLTATEQMAEEILHGLRSDVGVPRRYLDRWLRGEDAARPERLLAEGCLRTDGDRVRLVPRRRLIADEIAAVWLAAVAGADGKDD
jgi:oxygen-independent coproporphyrinogen-3 oxidase